MQSGMVFVREFGVIRQIKSSIVKITGLDNCMTGQLVAFSEGTKGFVMGFDEDEVLVLLLGKGRNLRAGDRVFSLSEPFRVPVGYGFLGRIVNHLCEPLDGKGKVRADDFYDVFSQAHPVLDRVPISEMLVTGIRSIDSSIPIGKGQRELIIGDRMTGKTTLAVDTVINQKDTGVICIYCCIGGDFASFESLVATFKRHGVLDSMVILPALGAAPIGEQYLVPFTAATLGEFFMHAGKDVLVVFDDLTKHAWAYRELSLLLERPPGREAYPGDIFHLHAQLMERAGKLSDELGGGSMTFFPIANTIQGDIAGFIPTNLISMTDGQIYLSSALFSEGFKPAIDLGLSVSRIGNKVQPKALRELAKDLELEYLQYRSMLKATRLESSFSEDFASRLRHGEKIEQIFIQNKNSPSPLEEQLILYYAFKRGVLDVLSLERCSEFKQQIFSYIQDNAPEVLNLIRGAEQFPLDAQRKINDCLIRFFRT